MSVILLVEDDQRLAQLVSEYLEKFGFQVFVESSGFHVERKVAELNPAVLILDINLPGKDGLAICKDVRPHFSGGILMLTARQGDADQILGFEYGADDYVVKPVEPNILLARVKALLRRLDVPVESDSDNIDIGKLSVQIPTRKVRYNDEVVELSSYEFDMLVELAKNKDKIVSRDYLYKAIYRREYDGLDRTVDVRISHLRKKFGDDSHSPAMIKTVWGKGYLFVAQSW